MKKYTKEELSIIWLDSFLGLEYKHKIEIYGYIEKSQKISEGLCLAKEYIVNNVGEGEYNTLINSANQSYLDYILTELDRNGVQAITFQSNHYPKSLIDLDFKPLVLYAKGNVELLSSKSFAIVGSRKSLPLSLSLAQDYAKKLLKHFTLITGIAEGVDSTVIKTALENGGKIISIIAGGFDNIYPSSNQNLAEQVVKNGLLISEQPPKIAPKPYFFPIRNRIIAGIAQAVLIVSGGIKSGTLYTAEYAGEYGRDLFAVPYNVGVQSGAGCNELIKRGAILTDNPNDILELYGLEDKEFNVQLSDAEKDIIKALSEGQMHIEKLSSVLGKRTFEIMPTLSILEIKGMVAKGGNVYELVRKYSEE